MSSCPTQALLCGNKGGVEGSKTKTNFVCLQSVSNFGSRLQMAFFLEERFSGVGGVCQDPPPPTLGPLSDGLAPLNFTLVLFFRWPGCFEAKTMHRIVSGPFSVCLSAVVAGGIWSAQARKELVSLQSAPLRPL